MTFDEILAQVLELLQREGRVSYRALRRRFDLDAEYLEDLKAELIDAKHLAVDEDGKVLVWNGQSTTPSSPAPDATRVPLASIPGHLAEKILQSRTALAGERKQVTVFFADIKDSTRLIEGLDPEAAQQLLDPAIQLMMDAVHRFEGTVNQVLGDGIMALFGAPIAHEDHALRACYAALALQSAVCPYAEEVRRRHGMALQLRLDPLPPASADEVLQALLGDDGRAQRAVPLQPLKPLLIARTEGNPFFLEESVRTLVETGVLVSEPGAYRLAQALLTIQVPATVQAVLAARLDRLPREDKRLLQTAAVIGTEIPVPLLQAIASAQRALALATADGDVVLLALANLSLGYPYQAQGDYRRAIDGFRQTVASLEGAGRHERLGQFFLPAVFSRSWLATCHAELGTFAEGLALGAEGLRIAEAVDHPASLMFASWGIGLLALRQGDLPRALSPLERAVGISQDADLPSFFPLIAAALGAAYTPGGRVADAVPLLTQALEQATAMETVFIQTLCGLSLGESHLLAGRLEEAYALAEHTLALARACQEGGHQAYALRLLGDIAACREPPESKQAKAHYRQALALAEALGMRPLQATATSALAPSTPSWAGKNRPAPNSPPPSTSTAPWT